MDTSTVCGVQYPWLEDADVHMHTANEWAGLVGEEVKIFEIPGNHFEPFAPRNVSSLSILNAVPSDREFR